MENTIQKIKRDAAFCSARIWRLLRKSRRTPKNLAKDIGARAGLPFYIR